MELHGFSGLDRIYLNATYFNTKFQNNQKKAGRKLMNESTGILDFIGQMEVIALSIHEFAHVCLRKVRHFKISTELRLRWENDYGALGLRVVREMSLRFLTDCIFSLPM